jgi:hypothetical protein
MEVWLGAENPNGTVDKYRVDRLFPTPPHLSAEEEFLSVLSVAVAQFCESSVVLTSSSSSPSSSTSLFFNIS